jgi:hypothetical protein
MEVGVYEEVGREGNEVAIAILRYLDWESF